MHHLHFPRPVRAVLEHLSAQDEALTKIVRTLVDALPERRGPEPEAQ